MLPINICAAMCDQNRGIGLQQGFPWTFLKQDYEYYTTLTQARDDPAIHWKVALHWYRAVSSMDDCEQLREWGNKVGHIKGRLTWESTKDRELRAAGIISVVISSQLSEDSSPYLSKVVPSFQDAVDYVTSDPRSKEIEKVWIMGGTNVYKAAINHPMCKRIYLTRVFGDFEADTFFPHFEDKFRLISDPAVNSEVQEYNGVRFQFEVYERLE